MKKKGLPAIWAALAFILLLARTGYAAPSSSGVTVAPEGGYQCDYGVDIPFTRSPLTGSYTFALYPGEGVAGPPEMTARVEVVPASQVNVHLPLQFDPAAPSAWTLRVTAHAAPGREGLDREASAVKTFTTKPACGCPAGTAGVYYAGAGTAQNPFLVATPGQLQHINTHLQGKHFKQARDIDLSSWGQWTPIGDFVTGVVSNPFTGFYDGDGKTITGCKINGSFLRGSLFGCVSGPGAGVKDLSAQDFSIDVSGVKASDAGAIANYLRDGAAVSGCRVLGSTISCQLSGAGVVAAVFEGGRVENCYADGNTVTGASVGGITSWMEGDGTVKNCFSYSNRLADTGGACGGIAANTYSGAPVLSGNFFLGTTASCGGGNPAINTGAAPITAGAFKNSSTFSGWDFSDVWYMPPDGDYPMLRCFS
ncbi:hypothetical protein [Harryflintia acetispora]|uniref:GLUG domain-containing protein n=1 Tax=Harryflintia acetispora TaxID=1849041 RepID=A0A9X8Y8G6_9FIRM|nr:hypothetical protein [Harryflintia acetispora]TCL43692.1 hypothetical protein EDD78_10426 [Harryflintia acetispora]